MSAPVISACAQHDGAPVHRIALAGGGLDVAILSWGATIQRLRVGGRDVILGFDSCEEYLQDRRYLGSVVGRFGNRIADGRFTLDGKTYQLSRNENGVNHLHGGVNGFAHRIWSIKAANDRSVDLSLVSPDGEEGYPGTFVARCRYNIESEHCLRITLTAETDAPTIVNLATHSYFNLDGSADISRHRLQIPADAYLPTDGAGIPTGELRSVNGTAFDFRHTRDVRTLNTAQRYDNTYVVAAADGGLHKMARVEADRIAMEVWSTEPGVQFFDGGTMRPMRGRDGAAYGPYSGLCLEPQRFPDSPNHAGFTDCTLRPGETYRQITEYRFDPVP